MHERTHFEIYWVLFEFSNVNFKGHIIIFENTRVDFTKKYKIHNKLSTIQYKSNCSCKVKRLVSNYLWAPNATQI